MDKMQITLKTLQQQTFKIVIDEEETVRVKIVYLCRGGVGVGYVLDRRLILQHLEIDVL